jgi:hypothetical protein
MGEEDANDHRSIPELEHTVLGESRLRYLEADDVSARLDLDLVLRPDHSAYSPPSPGERHCCVGGVITFTDSDAVVLERSGSPPAVGADGTLDLGHIDRWQVRDGHHRLAGRWGALDVWGDVRLVVDFPANYRIEFPPGLPGTGPDPIAFTGPHESGIHEGVVVKAHTGRGTTWIGNFPRGWGGGEVFALRTPNPDRFVMVIGRRAWYVDVTCPEQFGILDSWVYGGASLLRSKLLLVEGDLMACGIDRDGVRWTTRDFGPVYGPVTVIETGDTEATVQLMGIDTDQPARVRISIADGHRIDGAVRDV